MFKVSGSEDPIKSKCKFHTVYKITRDNWLLAYVVF
jgi:hypothetical protein